jgi:hypothetical protein
LVLLRCAGPAKTIEAAATANRNKVMVITLATVSFDLFCLRLPFMDTAPRSRKTPAP